ncbi:hypothetical protein [Haloechinothrix halophila]|uniref:hypothetical protein n=1 Tax=Haloechinothrix halophila TaxID=1069073 RepID=UPI0003F85AF7|nr:hypothetical protein [Haloechinothrix halophila]
MTYPPQPGPYGGSGGYGQPYPGQRYPGYQGQPQPGQPYPGQHYPEQSYPGQSEYWGQFPNQPYQGQSGGYGQPHPEQRYGQSGGYGQQYQGQPYQDGYSGGFPHQQPGYGPPPGDVPPPQPEPPKGGGKTGLVVGIALAMVLLAGAAVGITGFWQPGYFRDDTAQDSSLAANTSPSSSTLPPSTSPQPRDATPTTTTPEQQEQPSGSDKDEIRRVTDAVVKGINNRDAATVKPVSCDPGNERQADYDGFPDDLTVSVSGEPRIDGNRATVALTLRRSDTSKTVKLALLRPNGAWCASGINS